MKNKINNLFKVALLLLMTLAMGASARIVLAGKVPGNVGNIPMRFYTKGGDTTFDKICYTDSLGKWSVAFDSLNSAANFLWNFAYGTVSERNPPNPSSDYIKAIVPQTLASDPNNFYVYNGNGFGFGDTFYLDNTEGNGNFPGLSPISADPDSINILGLISDINTGTGLIGDTINIRFHDYSKNRDTIITTVTGASNLLGQNFSFPKPFFNNRCYIQCWVHIQPPTNSGYPALDTMLPLNKIQTITTNVWDGITNEFDINLSLGTRGFVADTFQMSGTIGREGGGTAFTSQDSIAATIYLALAADSTHPIDSMIFSRDNLLGSLSSGIESFKWNYPDSIKAQHAIFKLIVSSKTFQTFKTVLLFNDTLPQIGTLFSKSFGMINLKPPADSTDSIIVRGYIKDSTDTKAFSGATASISAGDSTYSYATPSPASATTDANGYYVAKIKNASKLTHVYVKVAGSKAGYITTTITKDTSGIVPGDRKNDTITLADIKLDTNMGGIIIPDSIIFTGTVKDSAGSKVLIGAYVRISVGSDTGHLIMPAGDTVQTGADGKYSMKLLNSGNLSNLSYKVESLLAGYALYTSSFKTATIATPGDGKNDSVKVADVKLPGRSAGDTLFVRGSIYDSTATLGKKALKGAVVKIFLAGTFSDLQSATTPIAIDTTDSANGSYEFKVWNSPKQTPVFCKIKVSKTDHRDTVIIDTANIFPSDWINDTIKVGAYLKVPIVNSFSLQTIAVVKTPVKIYDLSGRLIKSFVYETTGSTAGIPKYLRSIGVFQKMYVMEINEKSGVVRKQMINLK